MYLHPNAKLGLAGRLALVRAVEEGLSLKAAAARLQCVAGDSASLVASLARWWMRVERARGSLEPAEAFAAAAFERAAGEDLRLPARDRGAQAGRALAPSAPGQGAGQPRRVAPSRRSVAHGRKPLRALSAARTPRHRRPLAAFARLDASRDSRRLRLRARDRRRSLPLRYVELHNDEKAATVTGFVERALAFFAEHGIVCKRLMTDNGFS